MNNKIEQFRAYADAVNADRYRVTSIKMREDGSKQTLILDKRDGISLGFSPCEIEQHMPEMQRLLSRGENLYYTPLSKEKHHVLIDDLSWEDLDRLIRDGYQPAVILESSPLNYQAIITVQKQGSQHDRDVGNRVTELLNKEYGDRKLSGCIHPHRAPGFENRKPKHRREDDSYPIVRLLRHQRRECSKTLQITREIDKNYQSASKPKKQQSKNVRTGGKISLPPQEALITPNAYHAHLADIQRITPIRDPSRADSMIAIRLRVTGYNQASIESIIRQYAPPLRPRNEQRNWDDYAQRTACFAFSAKGDQQAAELAKYRSKWLKLK
ncbi:MAG: hypothetical protein B7X29_02455 [Halothiobacillus sp. 13-55-115]|jgi:hypothetical protein|nr:MAG: hypothetical protein B7X29_02455 [Halothiobacillus sp. 13-55-115]